MGDEIAVALRAGDDVVREVVVGQHFANIYSPDVSDGVTHSSQKLRSKVEENIERRCLVLL